MNVTPSLALLTVRQGTLQQWTNPLAGSRERSNSHELSMLHPTRLSLLTSGATPQAVQPPERASLLNGTRRRCEYARSAESFLPAVVLRGCAGCARLSYAGKP
jgi:hypothetical protein